MQTSHDAPTGGSPQAVFRLNDLPAELRNNIYKYTAWNECNKDIMTQGFATLPPIAGASHATYHGIPKSQKLHLRCMKLTALEEVQPIAAETIKTFPSSTACCVSHGSIRPAVALVERYLASRPTDWTRKTLIIRLSQKTSPSEAIVSQYDLHRVPPTAPGFALAIESKIPDFYTRKASYKGPAYAILSVEEFVSAHPEERLQSGLWAAWTVWQARKLRALTY